MKNINPTYLYVFIITLPIIDILTTFTIHLPLSLGAILRSSLLLIIFVILLRVGLRRSKMELGIIILPFILLIFSFIFQSIAKEPFLWMAELQFYMKVAYYVAIVLFIYLYREVSNIHMGRLLHAIQIAAIITASSYWIAIATNTTLMSYPYDKSGFSGWFFAANELSTIVLILLTCTFVAYFHNKTFFSLVVVAATLSLAPMIGTKTAFFGSIIILISAIVGAFFTREVKKILPSVTFGILFIILLPNTPALDNTNLLQVETIPINESLENTSTMNELLSSRDTYFEETKQTYTASPVTKKLFGLGYAGLYDSHPKTIEMDFYDLFFSFGIIGTIILLYPLVLVTIQAIRHIKITVTHLLLFGTYILSLGIAFYVGHVLFAPAVMSYIAILLLTLKVNRQRIQTND